MTKSDRTELTDFMTSVGIQGKTWTTRLENLVTISLDKQQGLVDLCHRQRTEINRLQTALQVQSAQNWTPPAMMS